MIDEFKVISIMNEAKLRTLKSKNESYDKNKKIKEYLKDETLFFKIEKNQALKILETVGVKQDQLDKVYYKLISPDLYYNLLNDGKINENDNNLVIKYKRYRYTRFI